jgi:hypothetical protein
MTTNFLPWLFILGVVIIGTWLAKVIKLRTGRSGSQPFWLYALIVGFVAVLASDQVYAISLSTPWKLALAIALAVGLSLLGQLVLGSKDEA